MKLNLIILIIGLIFFSGCGITGYYGSSDIKMSNEENEAMAKAQSFIGKSKSEVLDHFGKPRNILYNVGLHDGHLGRPNSYTTYDEVWYYKYEAGIPLLWPDQYGVTFYFIGDAVRHVTG